MEHPLKTLYGYDAEGHVTAVTAPAQQPWLLHYGTISGDSNTGRLLSVIRPSAATELGKGIAPSYTVKPTLSSTKPVVGTKISVSSNGHMEQQPAHLQLPVGGLQLLGKECSAIAGAVNQNYYPAKSDEGHTLVARVTALNGTGAFTAESAATSVVATGTPSNPLPEPPSPGTTSIWTVDYQSRCRASELPTLTKSEMEKWGQKDDPVEAKVWRFSRPISRWAGRQRNTSVRRSPTSTNRIVRSTRTLRVAAYRRPNTMNSTMLCARSAR